MTRAKLKNFFLVIYENKYGLYATEKKLKSIAT